MLINVSFAQDASYPPESSKNIPALNFKDTDIRDILRAVAYEYHTNVMIDNQVNTKASIALFNVSVFNAIKMIAEDNNLDFSYDNQRFYVKPKKEIIKTEPPPIEQEAEITFSKGKLKFNANNVSIEKVVQKLREITSKNYLLSPGISGRVTGTLSNVDLETGLKNLLQNNGFYYVLKDSIFYISRSAYYSSIDENGNPSKKNGYWVSAKNHRVTIDVVQANTDQVIDDISNQLGLQIIKLTAPTSQITIKCNDISVDKAFAYLFLGTEFGFKKDQGAYLIGKKGTKNLDNIKLLKLHFLRADKVLEKLPQKYLQDLVVNTSLEHNALVVSGAYESVAGFENYIDLIDKPVPQVLIEALVVDYNLDNTLQYGMKAGRGDSSFVNRANRFFPGVDVTLSGDKVNKLLKNIGNINLFGKEFNVGKLGKLPDDFYMSIKALEQAGVANVKSRPLLSSLNGHTASLKIGTVQNYVFNEIMPVTSQFSSSYLERERIEKIEANMSFEITPWVGPNNELTLEIKPEFQTPIGDFVPDKKQIPAINTRTFNSTVRLTDGETIILGGLIQESETKTEDKFPILGDIPFLGELFKDVNKKKSKGELIIYLTPKIFYGEDIGYVSYDFAK